MGKAIISACQPFHGHIRAAWGINISLQRDKEPSQPVLGTSYYLGISFSVQGLMYTSLFCLSMHHVALGQPHCYICSQCGGNRVFLLQRNAGCTWVQPPCWLLSGSAGHEGPMHCKGLDLVHSLLLL